MSALAYPHIELDEQGIAFVEGTRTKVLEIVLDRLAHHWDADEIHRQHPHLSLGQIYAALGYYHDHQEALNRQIEDQLREVDEIRQRTANPQLQAKLKASRAAS